MNRECHVCHATEDLEVAYSFRAVEQGHPSRAIRWICVDQTACVARIDARWERSNQLTAVR